MSETLLSPLTAMMSALAETRELEPLPTAAAESRTMTVTSLAAVEELLDWLERQGFRERKVLALDGGSSFLVSWR